MHKETVPTSLLMATFLCSMCKLYFWHKPLSHTDRVWSFKCHVKQLTCFECWLTLLIGKFDKCILLRRDGGYFVCLHVNLCLVSGQMSTTLQSLPCPGGTWPLHWLFSFIFNWSLQGLFRVSSGMWLRLGCRLRCTSGLSSWRPGVRDISWID